MRSPSRKYRAATNDTAAIMASCRKARRARRLFGKIVAIPLVIGFLYSNRAARETPRVATVPFFHDIGADVVRLLGPGAFFGEMSLLVGSPRNATIVATQSCALLALDIVDFRGLLDRQPDLARITRIIHEEADRRLAAGQRARRRAARNNVAGSPRPRGPRD